MKERYGHSEKGAALLVALLAVVFLTILGMVLLEVLRGGLTQAASSEASIQAEALAQSGIDEATAFIRRAVNTANVNADTTTYHHKVGNVHDAVSVLIGNLNGKVVNRSKGSYEITIDIANQADVNNYTNYTNNHTSLENYPYSRIVTVKSVGKVTMNNRKIEKTKTANIYVNTINPVFKYPLSAKDNLTINGAAYVVGDVRVQSETGILTITDKAKFISTPGSNHDYSTAKSTIKGFYKASNTLAVDNSYKALTPLRDEYMSDGVGVGNINLNIAEYVDDKKADIPSTFGSTQMDGDLVEHSSNVDISMKYVNQWVDFKNTFTISSPATESTFVIDNGVLTMASTANVKIVNGSLYVKYVDPDIAAAHFAGNLIIDNPAHAVVVEGNAILADEFKLEGNMYIDGSLKIIGSVNITGAIFVKGEVEMTDMKSINKDLDATVVPLLLASSGRITFSNSRPLPDATGQIPATAIRAFLYSEDKLDLYGVLTKLQFTGGVHGKEVTLNAVREDPSNLSLDTESGIDLTPESSQLSLTPDHSNLKIFYDNTLYKSPPASIPVTNVITMFVQTN